MPQHERGMGSITVSARGHVPVIEILFSSVTAKWMPATCALRSPSPCHLNTHPPQAHAPSLCHGPSSGRRKLKPYLGEKGRSAFICCEGPGAPGHTGVGSPCSSSHTRVFLRERKEISVHIVRERQTWTCYGEGWTHNGYIYMLVRKGRGSLRLRERKTGRESETDRERKTGTYMDREGHNGYGWG